MLNRSNLSISILNRYYCKVSSSSTGTISNLSCWGKKALVTGGSRGIGKAIAQRLAASGANVTILSKDPILNKEVVSSLPIVHINGDLNTLENNGLNRDQPTNRHSGLVFDLSVPLTGGSYDEMSQALKQQNNDHLLEFDILVHAAGITQNDLFFRSKSNDVRTILQVNLQTPIDLTRLLLKPMIKKQWGRVIFLGSVVADQGNRGQSIYSASKAGLVGFSKSLSREVGHFNITSNVISPGYIDTDMSAPYIASQGETLIERIPLKRIGNVEEIAKAALFLVESNYITGQVIRVDGGLW
ncbi:Short-chain dehydrogenase/reductase superfamily [Heterostelium album PN500]|uniref:Short-chain dehydrogenase/reductase superfamily n=1 Tax=Heterostelium pallidum (strain ATCC 26659 / Pp 5 / PN500) TaxID=670386 RepID=D3B4B8_HETP5|nr:Short-chain dehydrogenase/reductase superfamily [Heterostelium album PN500]EFA84166.1 Short-chain dehydrogenase/reductase superfamily [Heterostelium album PN500]|eukprot:XP_020436283.1 Short-chain dehydrogenase/reductase superfamily [Heterostelium album PN500]